MGFGKQCNIAASSLVVAGNNKLQFQLFGRQNNAIAPVAAWRATRCDRTVAGAALEDNMYNDPPQGMATLKQCSAQQPSRWRSLASILIQAYKISHNPLESQTSCSAIYINTDTTSYIWRRIKDMPASSAHAKLLSIGSSKPHCVLTKKWIVNVWNYSRQLAVCNWQLLHKTNNRKTWGCRPPSQFCFLFPLFSLFFFLFLSSSSWIQPVNSALVCIALCSRLWLSGKPAPLLLLFAAVDDPWLIISSL